MANVEYAKEADKTRKVAVFTEYGGKLTVVNNIVAPTEIGDNDVLVDVKSTSVNPIDWKLRRGDLKFMTGLHFPKTCGRDISGVVRQVGAKVTKCRVGDEVYGMPEWQYGTYTELVQCSEDAIARKPSNFNWNEAASVPLVALTAHECVLQIGKVGPGQTVLILGGSTGVGIFAIQFCKIAGAKVWATGSTEKVELIQSLGADVVIDYKKEDFLTVLGANKMDVVFDAVGKAEDRDKAFDVVVSQGIVVTTTPNDHRKPVTISEAASTVADVLWKKVSNYIANGVTYKPMLVTDKQRGTLEQITSWIEAGKVKTVVDSVYPLEQIQEANDKSENGKNTGKIVVEVSK